MEEDRDRLYDCLLSLFEEKSIGMSSTLVLGGMIVGIGIEFKIDRLVVDRLGLGIKEFLNRFIFLWYGLRVLELELL